MSPKNTPLLVEKTAALLRSAHDLHQAVLASGNAGVTGYYHPDVAALVQKLKDQKKGIKK